MTTPRVSLVALVLALIVPNVGCATTPQVGLNVPSESLTDLQDKPFDLQSILKSAPATVLVWWASTCPCVKRYAERVRDLHDRYATAGVTFITVASNADDDRDVLNAADNAGTLVGTAVIDRGGALARHFGVVSTPSVIVLDGHGAVRFHGWLDNERTPGQDGREAWLEKHLDAQLAGADVTKRTPTWGCIITRSLNDTGHCGKTSAGQD